MNFDNIVNKKICISCKTRKQFETILRYTNEMCGKHLWNSYKENTCVEIKNIRGSNSFYFCYKDYYEGKGYRVINFPAISFM